MSPETILIIAAVIAFVMAMSIGANDVANSMATAVGAKAITIKQAIIIAGILEFGGAYLFGRNVTETIKSGIFNVDLINKLPDGNTLYIAGAFAAISAAAIWVFIATFFSMPVSTSHSIVGAMAGFAIVAFGWETIKWSKMTFIVLSWFISPVLGGIVAFGIFKLISWLILHRTSPFAAARKVGPVLVGATIFTVCFLFFVSVMKKGTVEPSVYWPISIGVGILAGIVTYFLLKRIKPNEDEFFSVEQIFKRLQVFTSCYVSFAHGANDVANAIGPLAAIYAIIKLGSIGVKSEIPGELMILGGAGIAFGVFLLGYKVMKTIGENITELNNTRGFSIDLGTATTVLAASSLGLPVSSTHTVVGAVVGVGYARGIGAINLGILKQIVVSWVITVPIAAVTSALLFYAFKALLF